MDDGLNSFCAYIIEIPCEPVPVECGEPSTAPSGSYFPSSAPSDSPTESTTPSDGPSLDPSSKPSDVPSDGPTLDPSSKPSDVPSSDPSESPSSDPSGSPSSAPSSAPSESPSDFPSTSPSESPSGSFYPSSAPSDTPTESMYPSTSPSSDPSASPSTIPSASPSLTCEALFIPFSEDGSGIPTDLSYCVAEEEEILLPRTLLLTSQSGVTFGTVNVDFICTSTRDSQMVVMLNLNEGHTVTGASRVSILKPNEELLNEETNIELYEDKTGWTVNIPLTKMMPRQGTVLVDVVTEVDGDVSNISTGDEFPQACFDCGGDARYFANPESFLEHGFTVNAYSDDDAHTLDMNLARFMHTQLHDLYNDFDPTFISEDVDTCLIVQQNNTLTPYANAGGGNITFNFTDTTEEFFEFELFNIHVGATVFAYADDGTIHEFTVGPAINEVQNIAINVPNIEYVSIQFDGPGAVCGIKSCLEGTRPPSPGGNLIFYTPFPTISPLPSSIPSAAPSGSFYPSSAPSSNPTESFYPSKEPSDVPSDGPSLNPSSKPSDVPSDGPSLDSSSKPTSMPSASIQPTDCYDLYGITEEDIINQIGSEEPIPEDAIKIIHGENANVTIEINQLWSEDVNLTFFIHYHSDTHESVCEGIPDFSYEDTITKDLECYDGWTDVGIFIYFDEVSLEECEECRPPDSDEESVVAYYFELPCEPICESLEPTEAPVTPEPTKAPVSFETDCYDEVSEEDVIDQIGSGEPLPEDAIKIIHGENANVTIEISQLWSE